MLGSDELPTQVAPVTGSRNRQRSEVYVSISSSSSRSRTESGEEFIDCEKAQLHGPCENAEQLNEESYEDSSTPRLNRSPLECPAVETPGFFSFTQYAESCRASRFFLRETQGAKEECDSFSANHPDTAESYPIKSDHLKTVVLQNVNEESDESVCSVNINRLSSLSSSTFSPTSQKDRAHREAMHSSRSYSKTSNSSHTGSSCNSTHHSGSDSLSSSSSRLSSSISVDTQLEAAAKAWCPWENLESTSTTLDGWELPLSAVEQWKKLGVNRLHLWQRACLYSYSEHIANGLRRRALWWRKREAIEDLGSSEEFQWPSPHLVYSAPTSGGKALLSDIMVLRSLRRGVQENETKSMELSQPPNLSSVPSSSEPSSTVAVSMPTRTHEKIELQQRRRIAIYVLPFVALAEERSRHLETVCEGLEQTHVICLAGREGLLLDELYYGQQLLYVCTIEKAHALWRELENQNRLLDVVTIVVDEVHYINDNTRGFVLELFLTNVIRAAVLRSTEAAAGGYWETEGIHGPPLLQLILTSATIGNPEALARWCGNAFLFLTDYRPVPLHCFSVLNGKVYDERQHLVRDLTSEAAQNRAEMKQRLKQVLSLPPPIDSLSDNFESRHSYAYSVQKLLQESTLIAHPKNEGEEMLLLLALQGIVDGFQVILFAPTRTEAERAARLLATSVALRRCEIISESASNSSEKKKTIATALRHFGSSSRLILRDSSPSLKDGLKYTSLYGNVGFHHAGMGSRDRLQLEEAYRKGSLWALCCTTTLSTGMNLPCRRVIFTAPRVGVAPLTRLTFLQAAGRSGRVGLDPYGEAYLIGKPYERSRVMHLVSSPLSGLESNFSPQRHGVSRVLLDGMAHYLPSAAQGLEQKNERDASVSVREQKALSSGLGPNRVYEILLSSFYATQALEEQKNSCDGALLCGCLSENLFSAAKDALLLLESHRFIVFDRESSSFSLTSLGAATVNSLFLPEDALFILQDLQRSTTQFCLSDDLHLLYHCTPLRHDVEPDWYNFYHRWSHRLFQGATGPLIASTVGVEEHALAQFAVAPPPRGTRDPVVIRCKRLYGALLLSEIVRERTPMEVAERFSVAGGGVEIQRFMEAASLFASSLAHFAHTLNWWYLPPLFNTMVVRLRHGVAAELLPLMEIDGLTPWRARELFDRGYRTVRSVVGASKAELIAVFSGTSLEGFHLSSLQPEDGVPKWCDVLTTEVLVRQLQIRAKLVLQRAANDLQAVLQYDDIASQNQLTPQNSLRKDSKKAAKLRVKKLHSKKINHSSRDQVYDLLIRSETLNSSNSIKPLSYLLLSRSPLKFTGRKVVFCIIDVTNRDELEQFQHSFNSLWDCVSLSEKSRKGSSSLQSRRSSFSSFRECQPSYFLSIRAVPDSGSYSRTSPTFSLVLGLYSNTCSSPESPDGVVFCLQHCPAKNLSKIPIFTWWSSYLPLFCHAHQTSVVQLVWLGLQKQVRFLSRLGWLDKEALCSHFFPNHCGYNLSDRCCAPHDPVVAVWMLHPEVDSSDVINEGYGISVLRRLFLPFPCSTAEKLLDMCHHASTRKSNLRIGPVSCQEEVDQPCILLPILSLFNRNESQRKRSAELITRSGVTTPLNKIVLGEMAVALAAAAMSASLLQFLHYENLFLPYCQRESWMPLICAGMELSGVGFDITCFPPLIIQTEAKVSELTSYAYDLVGRSNWSLNSPQDCATVLYDDIGLPCLQHVGEFKKGDKLAVPQKHRVLRSNRSTKASVLVQLSALYPQQPLPRLLMEYRRVEGLSEKYLHPLQLAAVPVHRRGHSPSYRLFSRIFTTATATGRLAMSDPSLQTLPHPVAFQLHGKTVYVNIRRALVPDGLGKSKLRCKSASMGKRRKMEERTSSTNFSEENDDDGLVFLSADYSHIEARVLAHFSQDEMLLSSFPGKVSENDTGEGEGKSKASCHDIFIELGAELYHKNPRDITPDERRIAKGVWYGVMYGRGKNSLANDLGLTVKQADQFVQLLRSKYACTIGCMTKMAYEAAEVGYMCTLLGRKRWIPQLTPQRHGTTLNKMNGVSKEGWNNFERVAVNTLCQASAADIIKESMVRIAVDPLFQGGTAGKGENAAARLVLQVHDELLFEVRKKNVSRVISALRRHMEISSELEMRLPLLVNFKCGPTWGDMLPIS